MRKELGQWNGSRNDLARVLRLLMEEDDTFEDQLTSRIAAASDPGHYRAVASAAMPIPDVLRHSGGDRWPEALQGRDVPTMLVVGTRDELFEPHWPESVAKHIPHAIIRRIDARHSPNLDRPEDLVRLIFKHLAVSRAV
jgi:pimeloyl-ACP methyl ester carboxylesterase